MDNAILKKKLNTFKSEKGFLKDVSSEVVFEVLRSWEHWPGKSSDLYRELGLSKMQIQAYMTASIQNLKRLITLLPDLNEFIEFWFKMFEKNIQKKFGPDFYQLIKNPIQTKGFSTDPSDLLADGFWRFDCQ